MVTSSTTSLTEWRHLSTCVTQSLWWEFSKIKHISRHKLLGLNNYIFGLYYKKYVHLYYAVRVNPLQSSTPKKYWTNFWPQNNKTFLWLDSTDYTNFKSYWTHMIRQATTTTSINTTGLIDACSTSLSVDTRDIPRVECAWNRPTQLCDVMEAHENTYSGFHLAHEYNQMLAD
jgi:hypothetical protein